MIANRRIKQQLLQVIVLTTALVFLANCGDRKAAQRIRLNNAAPETSQIENDIPVEVELTPTFSMAEAEQKIIERARRKQAARIKVESEESTKPRKSDTTTPAVKPTPTLTPPAIKPVLETEPSAKQATEPQNPEAILDADLNAPIAVEEAIKPQFEKRTKQIKNKQAEIILDQAKMSSVVMNYAATKRFLSIQGHVELVDNNNNKLADTRFAISGRHSATDVSFVLKPDSLERANSNVKPVVAAKVTCLAFDDDNHTNCESVVIDFFIAYKEKIYTEQMEVKRKATKAEVEAAANTKKADDEKNEESEEDKETGLQQEGEEDSVLGRYKGQSETADLKEVFDKDDGITNVIQSKSDDDEDEKTEKQITPDIKQTKTGEVRPTNQAIGQPDNGRLRNATSLITKQLALARNAFFEVVFPARQRFYGTFEMGEMIARLGVFISQELGKKLAVSNISKLSGGHLPPHQSHQNGVDADLGYPTREDTKFPVVVQMSTRRYAPESYSVEKTFNLFKFAFAQTDIKVDRIFADRAIIQSLCAFAKAKGELAGKDSSLVRRMFKSIDHVSGHGDHFHIRLKCSSADPACREKVYLENKGCQ